MQSKTLANAAIDRPGRHEATQPAQQTRVEADRPAHPIWRLDRTEDFLCDGLGPGGLAYLSADGRLSAPHTSGVVSDLVLGLYPVGAELGAGDVGLDQCHADVKTAHLMVERLGQSLEGVLAGLAWKLLHTTKCLR